MRRVDLLCGAHGLSTNGRRDSPCSVTATIGEGRGGHYCKAVMVWVRRDGFALSTSARGGVDCAARPPRLASGWGRRPRIVSQMVALLKAWEREKL